MNTSIDIRRTPPPKHLVASFMIGLSLAAGVSGRLYLDELMVILGNRLNRDEEN